MKNLLHIDGALLRKSFFLPKREKIDWDNFDLQHLRILVANYIWYDSNRNVDDTVQQVGIPDILKGTKYVFMFGKGIQQAKKRKKI